MNTQSANSLSELAYLIASVLFILGLKAMTHPRTAARGNLVSAVGMMLAVIATVASGGFPWPLIVSAMVVGGGIGVALSIRVEMTKMPELVALFNGFGGIATVFVAAASMLDVGFLLTPDSARLVSEQVALGASPDAVLGVLDEVLGRSTQGLPLILSSIIGAVTFTGSIVAMLKLLELKSFRNPTAVPLELNMTLVALAFGLGCAVFLPTDFSLGARLGFFAGSTAIALVLGVTLVLPIGGADMPVVVALLNSYSGLAAARRRLRRSELRLDRLRLPRRRLWIDPHGHHVQGHEPFAHERPLRQDRGRWCRSLRGLCLRRKDHQHLSGRDRHAL